jgi:hypothetical protein
LFCLLGAAGCLRGAGARCEHVCRQEAECADRLDLPDTDVTGCIEACSELERDPRTQKLVEEHIHCVAKANGCAEMLECR